MPEVVVIGAGPAGLHAAEQACAAGASVTLVDASDGLGGQFWRHLPSQRPAAREQVLHHAWSRFTGLRQTLEEHPRCRILTGAQVWALEPDSAGRVPARDESVGATDSAGRVPARDESVGATDSAGRVPARNEPVYRDQVQVLVGPADGAERTPVVLRPDALVLATGAHDRVLPFPGWDLPGVFSAGAAQAMAKGERVAVGGRVVVAGAGPFLLPVAQSLTQVGAHVVGVHEAAGPRALSRGWLHSPWQLAGFATKMVELAEYAGHHLRHRIPYHPRSAVIEAHGTDAVEAVTIARVDAQWRPVPGTRRRVEVDAVCISHGFTPRLELPIAAGCALSADRFVQVDAYQQTSVPHVYAAGEITGIGGMPCAAAEGAVAGRAAAGSQPTVSDLRRRDRQHRFAERIEAAHGIRPGWTEWLRDETTICRCEEVALADLTRTAEASGSRGLRSLKLSTRAGLGICQGRTCGRTVEQLLAQTAGDDGLIGSTSTDRRPIAAPIRLAELAHTPEDHVTPKGQS